MRQMAASLYAVVDRYLYWIDLPRITVIDVIEVIIIAIAIYYILAWIKNSRAWALLRGIIIILIFIVVAAVFRMTTILWLAGNLASIAVIAVIIIFQPELRTALESLGRRNLITRMFRVDSDSNARMSEKTINDIVRACQEMGREKTGALIVVEQNEELREYIRTGIELDSIVSSQLLLNIFEENTPLHDGAVVVRGNRIVAATCYLPLSDSMELSKDLGTRHRAAVGVSEVSDSLTIVVSEETGGISYAYNRELHRNVDEKALREALEKIAQRGSGNQRFRERRRKRNQTGENGQDASSTEKSERGGRIMLKKIGKVIMNNFGLKVLAVIFAAILWLAIVNTADPEKSATFTVPVEVVNANYLTEEGKTYEILDNTDMISFTVTGSRSIVENLTADDFVAVANMENIDDSMSMVPISLTATSYSSQLEITRRVSYMMVDVENLVTRDYEILISIDGSPAADYILDDVTASPATVSVTGPESAVDEIQTAEVSINVNGETETFTSTEYIVLMNENGVAVGENDQMTQDALTTDVTATILMSKTVPLTFDVTGEPAEDYVFAGAECDQDSLTIEGDAKVLEGIEEIAVSSPKLSVEGEEDDVTVTCSLEDSLPDGVRLVEGSPDEVEVTLRIEPAYEEEVEMSADNITFTGLADGLEVTVTSDPVLVTLTGVEDDVTSVNPRRLEAEVDASDLETGNYVITIYPETDDNVEAKATIGISITEEGTSGS